MERGEPRPPELGVAAGETRGWGLPFVKCDCKVVMPGSDWGTRLPKEAGTALVKPVTNGEEVEMEMAGTA